MCTDIKTFANIRRNSIEHINLYLYQRRMYALVCKYIIIIVKLRIRETGGEISLYTSLIYGGNVLTYFVQIFCL